MIAREATELAQRLGIELRQSADVEEPTVAVGERLVTTMFADVRGFTPIAAASVPAELTERMTTLYRWARGEIERCGGVVDKFAGDAVVATFNVSGDALDHAVDALRAAISLRDKATLLDLGLGVGIAAGPAVVGNLVPGANLSVLARRPTSPPGFRPSPRPVRS